MNLIKRIGSGVTAIAVLAASSALISSYDVNSTASAASDSIESTYNWDSVEIGGGGFVSGIIAGQNEMYLRTDVGGAYKYNYETSSWDQLFAFINEADRGLLSVKGIAIDPTDDDTAYFLCGCAYFSDARTVIYKTTDGGETFTQADVTEYIQIHGNGDGRECIEPIAVDPDNPDVIYAGGDVTASTSALIKSTDGGETWSPVESYGDLGMYTNTINYPTWTTHEVKGTSSGAYNEQNGVASIYIEDGKVYVGTSITGQTNIHVADVDTDEFTELSADLPTENYPLSITSDNNGNLFFTYIAGLAFSGGAGGAYKYNVASGTVTDISPASNAIGMIEVDPDNPDNLLARTCGVWSDQWYEEEWTEGSIAWGDYFYRSTDGGETWTNITPGKQVGQYTDNCYFISNPIDTNGYDWIYGKACHWGSGIILDPRNSNKILLTSGNGVFACDNVWDEKGIQFYFDPKGIEEVVGLDMVSVEGGNAYSAIGDYDGFIHTDVDEIGTQYTPNIGSTGAIGYCSQNPDIMVRFAENEGLGYYSKDAGVTWTKMTDAGGSGGRTDIAQIDDDTYRIFHTSASGIKYSDDFGETWSECSGLKGTKTFGVLVDKENPDVVYAYTANYNEYWYYSKSEPTLDDAQYVFAVSTDGGETFTSQTVCMYDQCDVANRIAYLGEGQVVVGAGWYGMYISEDSGKTLTKLDVYYCKTVGYGAPEKEGDVNTLYMYGQPTADDVEGVYRSQDAGQTWVLINSEHLYGGTGNGNFLVGDMNEFGKVYMSTVGCGIVYGAVLSEDEMKNTTEKATKATTEATTKATDEDTTEAEVTTDATETPSDTTAEATTDASESTEETDATTVEPTEVTGESESSSDADSTEKIVVSLYGDVNKDDSVSISDVVILNKFLVGSADLDEQGKANADCNADSTVDASDTVIVLGLNVQKYTQTDMPLTK